MMPNPSLFGRHIERRTLELRALPELRFVEPQRSPRPRRPRFRLRIALGARLIAWGESLLSGVSDVRMGHVGRQPC